MFVKIAQALIDANFKPHVRTNDQEIIVRDENNKLWKITVSKIG